MIGLWLGLNLMDLITTLIALEVGYREGNPILSGLEGIELIVYKILITVALTVLLVGIKRLYLLKPLCFIIALVVVWNLAWVIEGG